MLTAALFYSGQVSTIGIYEIKVLSLAGICLVKKIKIMHVHEYVSIHIHTHALTHTHIHTHTLLSEHDRRESREGILYMGEYQKTCQIASNPRKLCVFKDRLSERTLTNNLWFQVQVFSLTLCGTFYDLPIQSRHGLCNI